MAMVHLRIVVPRYQSEHALDLLDETESVCNLVYLERAARRPEGDVILCDVAREDVSVIDRRPARARHRRRGLDRDRGDRQPDLAPRRRPAEKAANGTRSDPVVWEEVTAHLARASS